MGEVRRRLLQQPQGNTGQRVAVEVQKRGRFEEYYGKTLVMTGQLKKLRNRRLRGCAWVPASHGATVIPPT